MKYFAIVTLACASLLGTARANTYIDNNPADVWLNALNPSYSGEFTLAGYNPASEYITSATVEFSFFDLPLLGGGESFKVSMDDFSASHASFSGSLMIDGVLNQFSYDLALQDLSTDGALSYTVTRTSGELWLTNARIEAQSSAKSVPEHGTTVALLGASMVLLVAARRRILG